MPDHLIANNAPLGTLINLQEPDDVRRWSDRFGVTEAQLRIAIADVGDTASQVGQHLGIPDATRNA